MDFGNIIRKRESISLAKKKRRHFLLPFRQKEKKNKSSVSLCKKKEKNKICRELERDKRERYK
jgi:hypothetical protein